MSDPGSSDRNIFEATIVEDEAEVPQPSPSPLLPGGLPRSPAYRRRVARSDGSMAYTMMGLVVVLVLAYIFRGGLVDTWDGWTSQADSPEVAESDDSGAHVREVKPGDRSPDSSGNGERTGGKHETGTPENGLPNFEKRELPTLPKSGRSESTGTLDVYEKPKTGPGLAYSILSTNGPDVKVLVPSTYSKTDLMRAATEEVTHRRHVGTLSAVRFHYFTDKKKTEAADALGVITYTPEDNKYSVKMRQK